MNKLLLIIFTLFFLTACADKIILPDPDMALPTNPPDADLMQPVTDPQ
ncbi:hypothetical protein JW758_05250 [Candidatus Peregrinibacteria bacterium]|nr:hypothetical protein [Candidatus Peregrinibacteria bacterium]